MRHSERTSYNSCPFRYKQEHDGLRLLAMSQNSEDRNFGIAIHAGLKAFYDGKSWHDIEKAYSELYPQDKEYKTEAKSFDSGIFTLKNYIEYWSEQDKSWEIIATELADSILFNDEEHQLHIDLLARNKQTEEIWAFDHKTTDKTLGKSFWKKYELDSQVTRYTKYVIDKYGSCGGFIINGIQVGHRKNKYMGEPAGYYQKFDRQPFSRNKSQIQLWLDSERDWASMIAYSEANNVWPKHLSSLCSYCDYYALCLSAENESVKDTMYTYEPLEVASDFKVVDETQ